MRFGLASDSSSELKIKFVFIGLSRATFLVDSPAVARGEGGGGGAHTESPLTTSLSRQGLEDSRATSFNDLMVPLGNELRNNPAKTRLILDECDSCISSALFIFLIAFEVDSPAPNEFNYR